MREGIGAALRRIEDRRFLTGSGRFVADIAPRDALHCVILRSSHAHAEIGSVRTGRARAHPGVIAVITGADMATDGIGPMSPLWQIRSVDGTPMAEPPRFALARDRVRHVGEPVAAVIATDRDAAEDAAELIEIDYHALPAIADVRLAQGFAAPRLHAAAPGNVCFRWARGDAAATERAFAHAARIIEIEIRNNRIAGAAIEPRAAIACWDANDRALTLYDTTQVPHHVRRLLAAELGMAEGRIRVIAPDVGGGFGYKGKHYPEETIVAYAARKLGRAVKWVAGRSESFLSDTQARDHATTAALAIGKEGRFLGLRVTTLANLGAHVSTMGAAIPSAIYSALLAGVYRTPAIRIEVIGVFTNTVPTDAYRGAGRPEAAYVLERLADRAATALGLDRIEIRRRNLITRAEMPYATPIGPSYDCGDFPRILERVRAIAGYDEFPVRATESLRAGRLRGIGIACFVESSGVAPSRLAGAMGARGGFYESAEIRVDPSGGIVAFLGTHNHGQGHQTAFAQIIADRLGVAIDRIRIVEGDTGVVPYGTGTFGSRSIAVGGAALDRAAAKIIDKGRRIAAHLLEAAVADVAFHAGVFAVAGTDRKRSFADVAAAAHVPHNYPLEELEPGLGAGAVYDPKNFAYSNGAQICEVEIDAETGAIRIVGHWAVDDVGTVINPMIVEGQVHGGLAQGLGQALGEHCVYDAASAQPLAGSFMDYMMPRADDLPSFTTETDESQPCTHNPLGAKGCGESGAIGAPAALVSAVLDALQPLGVEALEMPLTPERIWQAIRLARARMDR